jgi:hypothetical protein
MSKKLEKIIRRKEKLEAIAEEGKAFCTKHKDYLTPYLVKEKRCYNGNHGKNYCRYLYII